jgi:hypothetical protein
VRGGGENGLAAFAESEFRLFGQAFEWARLLDIDLAAKI